MSNELEVKEKEDEGAVTMQSALIEIVKRTDIDPDRLEKFLDLQIKMEERQAQKALSSALARFQADCPIIKKTKRGHNSNYAPLDEIVFTIKPVLDSNGLSYSFNTTKINENEKEMAITVRHVGGGQFQSSYVFPAMDDGGKMNSSQRGKSANSYAKRALIENALGLVTADEDDDAKRAIDTPIKEQEIDTILELIVSTGSKKEDVLRYAKVKSLKELSHLEAKKLISTLRQKRSR